MQHHIPLIILASLCVVKAEAQLPAVKIHTQGLYAYDWKGIPHVEGDIDCDSIDNPNQYFTHLPLFFFYEDSSIALASDRRFHTRSYDKVDSGYFALNGIRLSAADQFGMYRSGGSGQIIAKMRYFEYSWQKFRVYYHFAAGGPDTLWLTEIDLSKAGGYVCPRTGRSIPVIKFDPALPFVFYPFPMKPDSSRAGFNKARWARRP